MRIAIDPVPVVLGVYAYVGELLAQTAARRDDVDPGALARRFARQRAESGDREVQRLVRALHGNVKTADKLLSKTADVWKISAETDLVDLVIQRRGDGPDPRAYVLLRPAEVQGVLRSIMEAARGAGEEDDALQALQNAATELQSQKNGYLAFGFDPWEP